MPEVSSDSKLYGAIAYIFGILSGVLMLLIKKDDQYVKFHAMQSILLAVTVFIVFVLLGALALVPYVGWILGIIGSVLLWPIAILLNLFLAYKAYTGEKFMLPVLGEQAVNLAK